MATLTSPMVSVGLPVYNGEKYLTIAIESVLAQTFRDIELIISDNASTDKTQELCESFAKLDPRIRYFRQPANRGAGFNYNFVFHESRGVYFRWLAHDDFIASTCLSACLEVLSGDPSLVLAYTHHIDVDENGTSICTGSRTKGQDDSAGARLWDLMEQRYTCEEVFGVIRSAVLRRTRLIADYTDSDRTLLGELALYGKFAEVHQPLFFHRLHPGSSVKMYPKFPERAVWFNPALKGRLVLSGWRQFYEMLFAIARAPIPMGPKSRCYLQAIRWFKWRWKWMFQELFFELRHLSSDSRRAAFAKK